MASPRPDGDLYEVRPADTTDLADIVEIERVSFPAPWPLEFFAGELGAPGRYQRVLARPGPGGTPLAGYLFAASLYDEFHIMKVATHPALQHRGYGRWLMEDALAAARRGGAATAILEVRVSNAPATLFYRQLGFIQSHRRRRYYADGEDAAVFVLSLLDPPVPSR